MLPRSRQILGWVAVSISTGIAGLWALWGSIENFHEGWFSTSLELNLAQMLAHFLSPMLIVMAVSAVALRWHRAAVPIFATAAIAAAWFFRGSFAALAWIAVPLLILGSLYHISRPEPRRWALRCVIAAPLATALVCGAYPGWRAVHRLDDGNYGMRRIEGNGITLMWAPEGPGVAVALCLMVGSETKLQLLGDRRSLGCHDSAESMAASHH